jgi:TatD DNase family protein
MFINIHTHQFHNQGIEIINKEDNPFTDGLFSYGIHPWNAEKWLELEKDFFAETNNENCLAIGEIGLDKLKGPSIQEQIDVFKAQIAISEQHQLPVIIHCVKAWNELKQLKQELKPQQPWIYHGIEKASIIDDVLQSGMFVSFGKGLVQNVKLQEALLKVPLNQLFLETDTADCSILTLYAFVSNLKNIPLHELENSIEQNFKRVFTKWKNGLNEQHFL